MAKYQDYQREAIYRVLTGLALGSALPAIVDSPQVQGLMLEYENADRHAILEQSRYRKSDRWRLWATTMGVIVGAMLLLPLDLMEPQQARGSVSALMSNLKTLFPTLAFAVLVYVHWYAPQQKWLKHRALAEHLRGDLIEAIVDTSPPVDCDKLRLQADRLKLLKEAYIADQAGFFDKRVKELDSAGSRPLLMAAFGFVLSFIAMMIGSFIYAHFRLGLALPEMLRAMVADLPEADINRWQLAIATMASGVLAHVAQKSMMDDNLRRAALYRMTAQKLQAMLQEDIPEAEAACARGEEVSLHGLLAEAREILTQEHAVWASTLPTGRRRRRSVLKSTQQP